jgi:hypothetical protein
MDSLRASRKESEFLKSGGRNSFKGGVSDSDYSLKSRRSKRSKKKGKKRRKNKKSEEEGRDKKENKEKKSRSGIGFFFKKLCCMAVED